jgi:hypothetical protein
MTRHGDGDHTAGITITDTGTTRRHIFPEGDPRAEGDSHHWEPQFQADCYNQSPSDITATVEFYLGQTKVGEETETVPSYGRETIALTTSYQTLKSRGLADGTQRTLSTETGESRNEDGGVTVHTSGANGGLSFPTLPAIGPLTARQTTLAAGLVGAVILAVVV